MSAAESFHELAERLKREREAERPRRYNQVAGKPYRPPLPAPLRLPAGDLRRQSRTAPPQTARHPGSVARKAGTEPDLPPPLFTGIFPYRPAGPHKITAWRWNPSLCEWIGFCPVCRYRFQADLKTANRLEREVETYTSAAVR